MTQILQSLGSKPDVYFTENDNSQVPDVTNVDQNATFFYGLASKGIVGRAVYLTSPKDLVSLFGNPKLVAGAGLIGTMGLWSAYQHLASGAGAIWFQRVVNTATGKAPQALRITLDSVTNTAPVVDLPAITFDYQTALASDSSDSKFYIYSNDPIYFSDFASQYQNISVSARRLLLSDLVGLTADYQTYLSNIVGASVAGSYSWALVTVSDVSTSPATTLETWVVNNSRDPMSNGLSYYVTCLNNSKYLNVAYSDLFEDTAVSDFFNDINFSPILSVNFNEYDPSGAGSLKFSGVADPTDTALISSVTPDRKKTPFRMILVNGFETAGAVSTQMQAVVRANKALVYAVGNASSSAQINEVDTVTGTGLVDSSTNPTVSATYGSDDTIASRCFPYVQAWRTFDSFTRRNVLLPASAKAILTIAQTLPWEIPAGTRRGKVDALKVFPELSDTALGSLYTKAKVNCIDKQSTGYFFWGQRTGQKTPSARDRIHAVRTLVDIENNLEGLRQFLFERATPDTIGQIVDYMESVKSYYRTGDKVLVFDYTIDFTNLVYNQLDVIVNVIVPESIEYIQVTVNVDRDRGAVFLESLLKG